MVMRKQSDQESLAGIDAAREFLLPSGEVSFSRAGLLFIESYRELPLLSWPRRLIDTVVDLESQCFYSNGIMHEWLRE